MAIALSQDLERLREQLEDAVRRRRIPFHEAEHIWSVKTSGNNEYRDREVEYLKRSMIDKFTTSVVPERSPPLKAAPAPNPNDIASLVMPLSQLKSLWAAKWGEKWVIPKDMNMTEDVAFWWNAYHRLHQQNCFESYTMANTEWRRLKEESPLGNS